MQECLGDTIKVDEDGCECGMQMITFNDTEKKILSKMETGKMIRTKIASGKRLN
jgi:hypothetical protein